LGRFCFYPAENHMAFPNMPKPDHGNPWNLTPSQERTLLCYSRTGMYKAVATTLGLKYSTINSTMRDTRKKMGEATMTVCAVKYALWRAEQLNTKRTPS
jgi:hypothetical protein